MSGECNSYYNQQRLTVDIHIAKARSKLIQLQVDHQIGARAKAHSKPEEISLAALTPEFFTAFLTKTEALREVSRLKDDARTLSEYERLRIKMLELLEDLETFIENKQMEMLL